MFLLYVSWNTMTNFQAKIYLYECEAARTCVRIPWIFQNNTRFGKMNPEFEPQQDCPAVRQGKGRCRLSRVGMTRWEKEHIMIRWEKEHIMMILCPVIHASQVLWCLSAMSSFSIFRLTAVIPVNPLSMVNVTTYSHQRDITNGPGPRAHRSPLLGVSIGNGGHPRYQVQPGAGHHAEADPPAHAHPGDHDWGQGRREGR